MCCGFGTRQFGIPIEEETYNLYSDELKAAWKLFDTWLKMTQEKSAGKLIDPRSMPKEVKFAMNLILKTPIPGLEGRYTGKDSCYMIGVISQMSG
jgi:hypothetical protein